MFSVMNYRLPEIGILPMHAGASRLDTKDTSIFFGLSGTFELFRISEILILDILKLFGFF